MQFVDQLVAGVVYAAVRRAYAECPRMISHDRLRAMHHLRYFAETGERLA